VTISESRSGWGSRVFSAITAPITALQRKRSAKRAASPQRPDHVRAAASTLYDFHQLTKIPANPIGYANTRFNQHSLQFSASKASQAIIAAEKSDWFLDRVCGTLEDREGVYKMREGEASELIEKLDRYWQRGGVYVGETWMSVLEDEEKGSDSV